MSETGVPLGAMGMQASLAFAATYFSQSRTRFGENVCPFLVTMGALHGTAFPSMVKVYPGMSPPYRLRVMFQMSIASAAIAIRVTTASTIHIEFFQEPA